ncbi:MULTISPECIES: hypothetical protein [Streptomyces]|uniref:hypothetical protein n=1 Tax=Streptomyces TaxID=1883 RepID=UPI00034EC988|nr:hypothetical protein [Streptomyces sp. HPH0547]EPD93102.1 hypothetical protein HMPREF1486_04179 [Streptomyces sp. HPH0547]
MRPERPALRGSSHRTGPHAMAEAAAAAARLTVDSAEHHQAGPVSLGDPHTKDFLSFVRARQDG